MAWDDRAAKERRALRLLVFVSPENPVWESLEVLERAVPVQQWPGGVQAGKGKLVRKLPADDRQRSNIVAWYLGVSEESVRSWRKVSISEENRFVHNLEEMHGRLKAFKEHFQRHPPKLASRPGHQANAGKKGLTDQQALLALLDEVIGKVSAFTAVYNDPEVSTRLAAAGNALGMSTAKCHKVVDAGLLSSQPVLSTGFHETEDSALQSLEELEGVYLMWMRRGDRWIKGALHVRHVSQQHGRYFVRARLRVPILNVQQQQKEREKEKARGDLREGVPCWDYDGLVKLERRAAYAIFHKRQPERPDFVHFITGRRVTEMKLAQAGGLGKTSEGFIGKYLTTSHEEDQTVASDVVVLQEVVGQEQPGSSGRTKPDEDAVKQVMWYGPSLDENEPPKMIRNQLDALAKGV